MKDRKIDWKFMGWTGLIFAVALGILFLFHDTVREEVLNPVLYLLWLGWLILKSVDQRVLWGGLWLVLLLVGARSLFPEHKPTAPGFGSSLLGAEPGRAQYWATQLLNAGRNDFFYQDARLAFRRLVYSALANRERISPEEVAQRIGWGEIQLPPEIRELLEERRPGQEVLPKRGLERIGEAARIWGDRILALRTRPRSPEIDPRWELVVHYIEAQLEREERYENE
jgi:hypothetical protein